MLLQENEVITGQKGTYQVQGKIGSESTFGAIFKALDGTGEPVVIKQLLGSTQIVADTGMDYDYVRLTFEREAQILTSHDHPQIVKGLDFFERDGDLLLAMEFINGEDLDEVLIKTMDTNGGFPFAEEEAVSIGYDLCRVIHAIHQLPGQVLYRDMKPRNVMWDAKNGKIKIIDFGTARFMESGSQSTQALGTPGYAPPEFYNTTSPLSFASDVYTIGATLFELVTGELPEALMTPVSFHGQETRLSEKFRTIICKAMDQKMQGRYQTAEAMANDLFQLPSFTDKVKIQSKVRNPYPYLSCLCMQCGAQPKNEESVFCAECGGKIHVMILHIEPTNQMVSMDLFLDKKENTIGRLDLDTKIFPDVDLSRYDPECYVSRNHAFLKREGTRFSIRSLNPTNPTIVNGYKVSSGQTVQISHDTLIELADLPIRFIVKPCLA